MAENAPKVGEFIVDGDNLRRDAIHIAVIPVVCHSPIKPGQEVGTYYCEDSKCFVASPSSTPKIGVVDPFLRRKTTHGDKVYVFLYPNTVKNLRHEWEHPDLVEPVNPRTSEEENRGWFGDYEERCPC